MLERVLKLVLAFMQVMPPYRAFEEEKFFRPCILTGLLLKNDGVVENLYDQILFF